MHRLQQIVDSKRDAPVSEILERIYVDVGDWTVQQVDDVTLLVLRYRPDEQA
jgi:hypothetical protein